MSSYYHSSNPGKRHYQNIPHYPHPDPILRGQNGRTAVRNTVKNMVDNLEHVITNLHDIVGDLRVLVHQIDVVTNKLDTKYGVHWDQSGRSQVTRENALKIKDTDQCGVCRWKTLQDNCDSAEFSPDIDWSYLGLGECNNNPILGATSCRPQLPVTKYMHQSEYSSVTTDTYIDNDSRLHSTKKRTKKKNHLDLDIYFDSLEISGHSSDVECDVRGRPDRQTSCSVRPVPQHTFCKDVIHDAAKGPSYCGIYESLMESTLERLSNWDSNSSFSEEFEDVTSAGDDVPSVQSLELKAEYDRHVNPWTSFSLVHIDSTHGSDELLSESASDILNDNYIDTTYINPGFDGVYPLIQQTIC